MVILSVDCFMALITCRYCGRQVSDKATACPHCGQPTVQQGAASPADNRSPQVQYNYQQSAPVSRPGKNNGLLIAALCGIIVLLLAAAAGLLWKKGFFNSDSSDNMAYTSGHTEEVIPVAESSDAPTVTELTPEEESYPAEVASPAEDVSASQDYQTRARSMVLNGDMAGFPIKVEVSMDPASGKCTGRYQNIRYKTKMSLSGNYNNGNLHLNGYADGTSYTFELYETNGQFSGECTTGTGKSLSVHLSETN